MEISRIIQDILLKTQDNCNKITPYINHMIEKSSSIFFISCGSTAIGVEAAIKDSPFNSIDLVSNLNDFKGACFNKKDHSLAVGISVSGLSVEVQESLQFALKKRMSIIYLSKDQISIGGKSINVYFDMKNIPVRFYPFATCLLVHDLIKSRYRHEKSKKPPHHSSVDKLFVFLTFVYQKDLIPVFISSDCHFLGSLLYTQYIEYIKKPAFYLKFPEWTHNLLWSLDKKQSKQLAFIHLKPRTDLSDKRFENVIDYIDSLKINQIVIDNFLYSGRYPYSDCLLHISTFYWELSGKMGIDPNIERSF